MDERESRIRKTVELQDMKDTHVKGEAMTEFKEICANCGCTYGSHHGGTSPWPRDYCPGHEGRMDWEYGSGTVFKPEKSLCKAMLAFDVALSRVERYSTCPLCHGTGTKTVLDIGEYDDMLIEYPCSCMRKKKEAQDG